MNQTLGTEMTTGYKTIDFTRAQELWDAIKPENLQGLYPGEKIDLIFRGQSESTWALQPNSYRGVKGRTIKQQIEYELSLLISFLEECDATGTETPENSHAFKEKLISSAQHMETLPNDWPPEFLYTTLSYAQHYGLPTRLLDWTKSSFAATYFAASKALLKTDEKLKEDKLKDIDSLKLSVWVLNKEALKRYTFTPEDNRNHVNVINVSSGINKNIASQKGCFTVIRHHLDPKIVLPGNANFDSEFTLEKFFEDWNIVHNENYSPLIQLNLPYQEVPALIKLCTAYHISEGILYPGAYGAARASVQAHILSNVESLLLGKK